MKEKLLKKITPFTLCFVFSDKKILLGYKKRGLGKGLWNGFGGKCYPQEKIELASKREFKEEANIEGQELKLVAKLFFYLEKNKSLSETYVFFCHKYLGEIQESEEIRPQWFSINKIPYETMWSGDIFWLPLVLKGHLLQAYFRFNSQENLVSGRVRCL